MMVPVGSATRFISRCRSCIPLLSAPVFQAAAYRVRHFRLTGPYRVFGEKKGRAMRVDADAMLHRRKSRRYVCYVFGDALAWLEKTYRVVVESNLKKKEKEKIARDAAPRENANVMATTVRVFEADARKHLHLAALLCLPSRITLYLSSGNLRIRVITDSADLVTREATQQKRDNVTILSVHLVYCRSRMQIY